MFKCIVAAVHPEHIDRAVDTVKRARAILSEDGTLLIVSAVEPPPYYVSDQIPRDLTEDVVREAENKLSPLLEDTPQSHEVIVRSGDANDLILGIAKDRDADLIMVASHRPGFSDYFLGSTASKIVRHAQTNVLVLR